MVVAISFGVAHVVLYSIFGGGYCESPLATYLIVAGICHLIRAFWIICCSTPTYVVERDIATVGGSRARYSGIHQVFPISALFPPIPSPSFLHSLESFFTRILS